MVKKTFKELKEVMTVFNVMCELNENLEKTKFAYAVKRFIDKNCTDIFTEYNNELNSIRIDLALVDPTTQAIIMDKSPRGFAYDRKGLKEVLKQEEQLNKNWSSKEYEVTPWICKGPLPALTAVQIDVFNGLVIDVPAPFSED